MSKSFSWQHLDADGEKIVHGERYVYISRDKEEKELRGLVEWHPRYGYILWPEGKVGRVIVPFEYKGERLLSYPRLRRIEE